MFVLALNPGDQIAIGWKRPNAGGLTDFETVDNEVVDYAVSSFVL